MLRTVAVQTSIDQAEPAGAVGPMGASARPRSADAGAPAFRDVLGSQRTAASNRPAGRAASTIGGRDGRGQTNDLRAQDASPVQDDRTGAVAVPVQVADPPPHPPGVMERAGPPGPPESANITETMLQVDADSMTSGEPTASQETQPQNAAANQAVAAMAIAAGSVSASMPLSAAAAPGPTGDAGDVPSARTLTSQDGGTGADRSAQALPNALSSTPPRTPGIERSASTAVDQTPVADGSSAHRSGASQVSPAVTVSAGTVPSRGDGAAFAATLADRQPVGTTGHQAASAPPQSAGTTAQPAASAPPQPLGTTAQPALAPVPATAPSAANAAALQISSSTGTDAQPAAAAPSRDLADAGLTTAASQQAAPAAAAQGGGAQAGGSDDGEPESRSAVRHGGTRASAAPGAYVSQAPQVAGSADAAPVRAAQAPAAPTVTVDHANVVAQVARHMDAVRLRYGTQEVTVNLQPAHLGEVRITITRDGDGVSARILAETPSARQAMEAGRDNLRESLEQRGLALTHLEVGLHQGWSGGRTPYQEPQSTRPAGAVARVDANGAATEPAAQAMDGVSRGNTAGRLDYRA